MNGTKEIASGLVIASGDGAVLLESGKEALDQVTGLVQMLLVTALLLARAARGNHDRLARPASARRYARSFHL